MDNLPRAVCVQLTADVHIIEPQGSELWLDVKIHTVNPDHVAAKELLREKLTKCRAHGQRDGFNLQALDKGMTPVVLEQFGRTTPGAQAIFNRIINHRLQILVRQGIPFSFAKRTASSELRGPISCALLRAAWQAHADFPDCSGILPIGLDQKRSRSLWRSQTRKSRSVPEGGADFQQPFSLPENAQTLAGIASRAAGKPVTNFPAASKFCRKILPARNFGQPQPSRAF